MLRVPWLLAQSFDGDDGSSSLLMLSTEDEACESNNRGGWWLVAVVMRKYYVVSEWTFRRNETCSFSSAKRWNEIISQACWLVPVNLWAHCQWRTCLDLFQTKTNRFGSQSFLWYCFVLFDGLGCVWLLMVAEWSFPFAGSAVRERSLSALSGILSELSRVEVVQMGR